jgi:hypothetical protein
MSLPCWGARRPVRCGLALRAGDGLDVVAGGEVGAGIAVIDGAGHLVIGHRGIGGGHVRDQVREHQLRAAGVMILAAGGRARLLRRRMLRAELRRFEHQLRAAGLKETSVTTYVDRTGRFLKWLEGDYQPRGPN